MTDLGSRFMESEGAPVALDGRLVHMSHVMTPLPSGIVTLRMRPTGDLDQGVGLDAEDGWMTVNGEKSKKFALWASTAPPVVEIALKPLRGRSHMSVRVWNVWKLGGWGSTMAWVANAGLLIEPRGGLSTRLHASAGPGRPSFDDLTIDLDFVPA